MARFTLGASARFFMSLGIVVLALAGMAAVGLRGLANVDAANRQVFSDNFLTAEDTSHMNTDLDSAIDPTQTVDCSGNQIEHRDRIRLRPSTQGDR